MTPLHIALITAAIANGGSLYQPSLELGRYPKAVSRIMKKQTARKLQVLMRSVVEKGTGYRANISSVLIAGKTGTAEVAGKQPHSWFASFAPVDNARMVVVVLIENGGYGGAAAAEAARHIYETAVESGYFLR